MNDLVEFLRARLTHERAEAEKLADVDDYPLDPWAIQWEETGEWNSYPYLRIAKARVLAEVEAKRQLVDMFAWSITAAHVADGAHDGRDPDEAYADEAVAAEADGALRLLALPYASHPDYRAEWRP